MGIPKKGSRKFSLDGRNYRYIITPETIKVAIQMAIAKGWEPSKKGAPFILGSI